MGLVGALVAIVHHMHDSLSLGTRGISFGGPSGWCFSHAVFSNISDEFWGG